MRNASVLKIALSVALYSFLIAIVNVMIYIVILISYSLYTSPIIVFGIFIIGIINGLIISKILGQNKSKGKLIQFLCFMVSILFSYIFIKYIGFKIIINILTWDSLLNLILLSFVYFIISIICILVNVFYKKT